MKKLKYITCLWQTYNINLIMVSNIERKEKEINDKIRV